MTIFTKFHKNVKPFAGDINKDEDLCILYSCLGYVKMAYIKAVN